MSEITERRLSAAGWTRGELVVVMVALAWVAAAAFLAVPTGLTVDGFIYHAMIDAFARDGSLAVANGYETYGSDALKLALLRESDGRLVAQYPGGWGILAALAYMAAGLRGVILINAVASALTLALVWQAARALFEDRRLATHAALIYGLATFAVDYAFGVWPHGVTTFLVAAAFAAVATGWRGTPSAELRGALVVGLALGAGVNLRVDALFAVAPIGIWLLGAGRRPHAALGLLLAGLVPGLAAAAAINLAKFGVFNPVTYGTEKGATSLGYYRHLAPVALGLALGALAFGFERVRAVVYRPRAVALIGLGALALCLAVPPLRELAWRIVTGVWVLVADFQAHAVPGRGITLAEDGTLRAFGVTKKALLQSMPYAAAVLVLLPRLSRGPDRPALALCFLFVLVLMVPFAYGSWHGGAAKNMRYFLNFLPALAILSAVALREITAMAGPRSSLASWSVLAVVAGALGWGALRGYEATYILEVTLPNAIAASVAMLSVAVLLGPRSARGTAATMLAGMAGIGLIAAFLSSWVFDLRQSQFQRAMNLEIASLSEDLPGDALLVTDNAKFAAFRLNRPPALTAQTDFYSGEVGPDLIRLVHRAFAGGRPVFAQGHHLAERLVAAGASSGFVPRYGIEERFEVYRMTPTEGDTR